MLERSVGFFIFLVMEDSVMLREGIMFDILVGYMNVVVFGDERIKSESFGSGEVDVFIFED